MVASISAGGALGAKTGWAFGVCSDCSNELLVFLQQARSRSRVDGTHIKIMKIRRKAPQKPPTVPPTIVPVEEPEELTSDGVGGAVVRTGLGTVRLVGGVAGVDVVGKGVMRGVVVGVKVVGVEVVVVGSGVGEGAGVGDGVREGAGEEVISGPGFGSL